MEDANTQSDIKRAPLLLVPWHGLLLAISFLTRLPLKTKYWDEQRVWGWSMAWYPLCGYLIGALAVAPMIVVANFLPPVSSLPLLFLSSLYYLAALEWLTRMLHFDGFCDCCDAFSSMASTPEKRREIMKDPHVGSTAVGCAVLLIVAKAFTLNLIIYNASLRFKSTLPIILLLILAPGLARFAMLCLASIGRYPREAGTGLRVVGRVPWYSLLIAACFLAPLFLVFDWKGGAACFFFTAFVVFYWKIKADAKIGGVTGDVLGACLETAELAAITAILLAITI